MNHVILVGTVDKCPEIILKNSKRNNKLIKFRLKTEKPFRSKEGEVLDDFINVKVWDNNIDDIYTILEVNNVVGVKGRISSFKAAKSNDFYNEIIADRLFFIS